MNLFLKQNIKQKPEHKCTMKWGRRYTAIFMYTFRVGFYTPRKGKGCVTENLKEMVDCFYGKGVVV